MRQAAHTLKSSSAAFGARELARACERIESACRDGDWSGLSALITFVVAEHEKVQGELADLRGSYEG